ncbi:hypothetical protein [Lacrimispora indolis]|uniref:hypothetical protein n=1 Tax=Lacrimispora indolis TaxID=69825 RepID=UPI0004628641|nr:hypothetical protein [[Clostridium] methoxybenzovorans]
MKINNDCIRVVLNYIIENVEITVDRDNKADIKGISMLSVMNNLSTTYQKEEVVHAILYASKYGLIDMQHIKDNSNINLSTNHIYDVTPMGYKFLETE